MDSPRTRQWSNRIVGYAEVSPNQLSLNPRNFRLHPANQQEEMAEILQTVGLVQDIIVSKRTGYVLDGHLRLELAIREEQLTVPVKYVDLEPHEENFVLTTFDGVGYHAIIDTVKLDDLIKSTPEIAEMLANAGTPMEGLLNSLLHPPEQNFDSKEGPPGNIHAPGARKGTNGKGGDEDFDVELALQMVEAVSAPGDIWKCGRHTVVCADINDPTVIDIFFKTIQPTLVWSDPFVGKPIVTSLTDESLATARRTFVNLQHMLAPKAIQFWWGANNYPDVLPPSQAWLVWDKDAHGQAEPDAELAWMAAGGVVRCFRYGWGAFNNERVVEGRPDRNKMPKNTPKEPPHQKPVALAEYCFNQWGKPEDFILDPFVGSGTSLIAAERMTGNQRVFGFTTDSRFLDVTLQRWIAETGGQPRKVSNIYDNGTARRAAVDDLDPPL
jgi:hypothetical protein